MIKSTIKYLLFLLPIVTFAQNRTYIGAEFGPKFDVYQYTDNGNGLYTQPFVFSSIYGFIVGQELNRTFAVETGFYINNYGESYGIKGDFGYSTSNAIVAYQLPLKLKSRLPLIREKLNVAATIGYTFAINSSYGASGMGYGFVTNSSPIYNDSTRTEDISTYSLEKNYGLIEMGLSLDYTLKNSWTLYIAANYMKGWRRIVQIDVKYWINDQPEQTGTVFSTGDYLSIAFGARYPISNFWTKKPDNEWIKRNF